MTDTREEARPERSKAEVMRLRILRKYVKAAAQGLTGDEAAEALGLSVLSVRPRITELKGSGVLVDAGERRFNRMGKREAVLVFYANTTKMVAPTRKKKRKKAADRNQPELF